MAKAPTRATIRTYHVGFGDCFLISFQYARKSERHVLIDFGSTGFPEGVPKSRMMDIAEDIKQRTGGKLHAVVATHRHRDHISGFATAKARNGTGDIIKSLKPDLVVQPWTEDPKLAPNATGPSGSSAMTKKFGAAPANRLRRYRSCMRWPATRWPRATCRKSRAARLGSSARATSPTRPRSRTS